MAFRLEKDRTALKNRIKKTLDRAGIRPRFFNLNHQWTRGMVIYELKSHLFNIQLLMCEKK
ncbi:MAG: hypothetical protein ACTSYC_11415, partial [Promethearchaeota archaeon]